MNAKKNFDLVVYGATGFTGSLVAEYLAQRLEGKEFRWAIAGRSSNKLDALRARIVDATPRGAIPQIIVADSGDQSSLSKMAEQARVIATTVGPYALYGEPLVKACLAGNCDYLDITGEPSFVNTLLDRYHGEARDSGVLVINCCGFDSIPADLGALYTVQQLPQKASKTVRCYVKTKGKASGGTWASLVGALAEGLPKTKSEPSTKAKGPARIPLKLHRAAAVKGWGLPLPIIDPLVVKRSSRLRPEYGPNFAYGHFLRLRSLPQVAGLLGGLAGLYALAQTKPTRNWLLDRRKSGEGPSEEERLRGFFELTFIGETDDDRVMTRVSGGDPGYTETSKMLAESAILVAEQREALPHRGGVLTPASALGDALVQRLRTAGINFEKIAE